VLTVGVSTHQAETPRAPATDPRRRYLADHFFPEESLTANSPANTAAVPLRKTSLPVSLLNTSSCSIFSVSTPGYVQTIPIFTPVVTSYVPAGRQVSQERFLMRTTANRVPLFGLKFSLMLPDVPSSGKSRGSDS
jgi:hypothetical protein